MYTPKHFAEHDLAGLDALVARDAFATLVTVADGAPFASHLPVLYRRDGDHVANGESAAFSVGFVAGP